jgi:hypothetical protein
MCREVPVRPCRHNLPVPVIDFTYDTPCHMAYRSARKRKEYYCGGDEETVS